MAGLRTEFDFTLPKGFVGDDGVLHRRGSIRLATARDEIEPLRYRTIDGADDPYLTVLVLARVVTRLGSLTEVTTDVIEGLFAADLAFLQDLYGIINFGDQNDVEAFQQSVLDDGHDGSLEPVGPDAADSVDAAADDEVIDEPVVEAPRADEPPRRTGRSALIEEVVSTSRT